MMSAQPRSLSELRESWRIMLGLLLLLIAAALMACGGGKGPTAPRVLTEAAVAEQSFRLINSARGQEGLGALDNDLELDRIAREHSRAMRDEGFFGHTDPSGNGLRSRLEAAGVSFAAAGENLAQVDDHSNPAGLAHQQLLASLEHRIVMLDDRFLKAGVGVARSGDTFWITQVFLEP